MADISWLAEACDWLVNNPLFSGVGGTILVAAAGWLFGRKRDGQRAKASDGGTVLQAGRDISLGGKDAARK